MYSLWSSFKLILDNFMLEFHFILDEEIGNFKLKTVAQHHHEHLKPPLGYDHKGPLRTITGNRIWTNPIPVLVTRTGI